jgi:hypothetical protein
MKGHINKVHFKRKVLGAFLIFMGRHVPIDFLWALQTLVHSMIVTDVDLTCITPMFVIEPAHGCKTHDVQQECPTLWRLYRYHTTTQRDNTLRVREAKRHLGLGKGGEGYIAMDEWCYNCGSRGHWGDVNLTLRSLFTRRFSLLFYPEL